MKVTYDKSWPGAKAELTTKYATGQPVLLWYRDNQLEFTITSIKLRIEDGKPIGDRAELTNQEADAVIYTTDESDNVELSFYSKG